MGNFHLLLPFLVCRYLVFIYIVPTKVYNGSDISKCNIEFQVTITQLDHLVFKMDTIQKNDSIILKGTNFKSKPVFASFSYPKFDALIRNLMLKYGETMTNGLLIKGKEILFRGVENTPQFKPVPIPLQPYFRSFYYSMLLVVGSDDSDTLVLTSPIAENVRRLFGFSRWSRETEHYEYLLQWMESETSFIPLTYNCTRTKLENGWHKTVHLRKRNTVELYVVPKPLEYFPMLFVNCSMDNARNIYDNVTTLMMFRNDPLYYSPYLFTCAIFRPIMFNIVDNRMKHRRRLPGIDVTDEEFVVRRSELLCWVNRYMVSDCKCRSNTAALAPRGLCCVSSWETIERGLYDCFDCLYRQSEPPRYTPEYGKCDGHSNEKEETNDAIK